MCSHGSKPMAEVTRPKRIGSCDTPWFSTREKRVLESVSDFAGSLGNRKERPDDAHRTKFGSCIIPSLGSAIRMAPQPSIGFTIERIHSRICGKRNSFFSIASVMNLWAASGSTSRKYPFARSITSVSVKLTRLFHRQRRGCFPVTPLERMLPQSDRCSSHFVVGRWRTLTVPCLECLEVHRIPQLASGEFPWLPPR